MDKNKKLTLVMPEQLHSELKVLAVIKKTTMRDIVLKCIQREIREYEEESKK